MRITYRHKHNRDYWEERWSNVSVDTKMENTSAYPLKYAQMTVADERGSILEAGCGAGRILRYYKDAGWEIKGIDFIDSVVEKLKQEDPALDVEQGDITALRFADQAFKYVFAFGLYHNLEHGLDRALSETFRVTQNGGRLCASFRADNIQTKLVDYLADTKRNDGDQSDAKQFHKLNLTRREVKEAVERAGFVIEDIMTVENMPLLYKFEIFRHGRHKVFNESLGRQEGYLLNTLGSLIQRALISLLPSQFCNLFVVIARKP